MKPLARFAIIAFSVGALAVLITAGAGPPAAHEPVTVAEFRENFARVGMPETMRATTLLPVEGGMAVIEVRRMSLVDPKKWSTRRVAVRLDDLDPTLRARVELLAKLPPGTGAALLQAARGMKPVPVPEGLALRGEGPEFLLWLPPGADPEIDLSAERGRLEVLLVDPQGGQLRPQRELLIAGGRMLLPMPDPGKGGIYWLRPVGDAAGG